ncbi:hypothetical protein OG612_42405 (plasmid) [Streptomyces sp. NBC_01527]|uniref:hypothetical protein n=1 Tax=unclassified Streptomyces TaxID=2593676 RepID=UPI002E119258|nr:hypothetical protein OG763_45800 [Streptomyces sp. NBC_01230]
MPEKVPKAIKRVSKQDLVELSSKGERLNLGRGREPGWLGQHLADDATGSLRAILLERPPKPCYRCLVLIKRTDREVEHFLHDVLPEDFDRLEDIAGEALLTFTPWASSQIPLSPLSAE